MKIKILITVGNGITVLLVYYFTESPNRRVPASCQTAKLHLFLLENNPGSGARTPRRDKNRYCSGRRQRLRKHPNIADVDNCRKPVKWNPCSIAMLFSVLTKLSYLVIRQRIINLFYAMFTKNNNALFTCVPLISYLAVHKVFVPLWN